VQVVEGLVGGSTLVQPAGKAVPRKEPVGCKGDAAIGDAVADIRERAAPGEGNPLARLTADLAGIPHEEHCAPAFGDGLEAVRNHRRNDTFALEHRLDQLAESRRDDQRVVGHDKLGEPRPDDDRVEQPREHVGKRCGDRGHLGPDHLVEGEFPLDPRLQITKDVEIAKALDHHVKAVTLGDRPVPVEDDAHLAADAARAVERPVGRRR
jgi:hypothetical protein